MVIMKVWDVESYVLVEIGQRFRRAYCFHRQGPVSTE